MFKDTTGKEQSDLQSYFAEVEPKPRELPIEEVVEYIRQQEWFEDILIPIAYVFAKTAEKNGEIEPVVRQVNLPYVIEIKTLDTQHIQDNTLYLTEEVISEAGRNQYEVAYYAVDRYGKVDVSEKYEVSRVISTTGVSKVIRYGTKEWLNILTPSYVNKNHATNILINDVLKSTQTVEDLNIPLELQQTSIGAGFTIDDVPFVVGRKYTISFEYEVTQGILNDISYYDLDYQGSNIYINDELITTTGYILASRWAVGGGKHTYYMHFTPTSGTENVFSWQFNYEEFAQPTKVWITNLKIHEGHIHPFREKIALDPVAGTVWQTRSRTEVIPYVRETVEKPDLLPSQSRIERSGVNGHRTYQWTVEVTDGFETGNRTPEQQVEYVEPVNEIYWQGTKVGVPTIPSIVDYGAVGDNSTDNFNAIQTAVLQGGDITIPNGNFYLKGATNARLETYGDENEITDLTLIGEGGTLYPENNRTINRHEHYVMQLFFAEQNEGATIRGVKVNGSRNNINNLFAINPKPFPSESEPPLVPSSQVPLQRGFQVVGASELLHEDNTYTDMFGGYILHAIGVNHVTSRNNIYNGVGGNIWTENLGMAHYIGDTAGDTVVEIINDKVQGLVSQTDPSKMSWIGFVLENGSIQNDDRDVWVIDTNTQILIEDTDYLDFETGYHLESQAGNIYLNIWGGHVRVKNYLVMAGINGEVKVRVYNQTIDFIPNKRQDFLIQGLMYSEQEEADYDSGLHKIEFYNCTFNYPSELNKDGTKFNPALSYADNAHVQLFNCTLNNVQQNLVQNASATLTDCQINLANGNNRTTLEQLKGPMSKPEQHVTLIRTPINPFGSWADAVAGAEPSKVQNTGYVAPELLNPIGPAPLDPEPEVPTEPADKTNLLNNSNVFSAGSNDLLTNGVKDNARTFTIDERREIHKWESDGRIRWFSGMIDWVSDYTIAFRIRKKSGTFNRMGGYLSGSWEEVEKTIYKDGVVVEGEWDEVTGVPLDNTTVWQEYVIHLTTGELVGLQDEFTIEPNPVSHLSAIYEIEQIGLYKGHIPPEEVFT